MIYDVLFRSLIALTPNMAMIYSFPLFQSVRDKMTHSYTVFIPQMNVVLLLIISVKLSGKAKNSFY